MLSHFTHKYVIKIQQMGEKVSEKNQALPGLNAGPGILAMNSFK